MKYKVIKAIVLFVIAFGMSSLITAQVITMDRYVLDLLFLVIVLTCLIIYFRKILKNIVSKTKKSEIVLLSILSVIIHIVSSYFILNYLDRPMWPFDSRGSSFLLMNNYYLWVKPLDILLQQLFVILLVTKLSQYKLTLKQIITILVLGFGLIHIFQIFRMDLVIGLTYTMVAIIFSFIFPYMILKVKNGYIYNYMIHLGIYNMAALLLWMLY